MSNLYPVVGNNTQIQGQMPFRVLHQSLDSVPPTTIVLARPGWTEALLDTFAEQVLGIPSDQSHLFISRDAGCQIYSLQNDQGAKVSSVLLPFDAFSANPHSWNTLLSLSNFYMVVFGSPLHPSLLHQNADQYMSNMVVLLNRFQTLRHVVLPLDLAGRTTSLFAALRRHTQLSVLDIRLPGSYVPTLDDISRLTLLLAVELHGFNHVQALVIPSKLVDWMVIANIASLEGLEDLRVVPEVNEGGDDFVNALLNLGDEPFVNGPGFPRLRMIEVGVNNTSAWATDVLRRLFPNVEIF